ncbi:type VI secretion system ATPase TssH [Desulfocurvibacter africanus]|uniref:type VI secretion system ATPase TssH n=1 Tax=Desulfocurvibacter africanus TaxID=873 RepID=UPI002FDAC1D3
MIDVDIKALLSRLGPFSTTALQNAAGLCVSRTNYEVTVEHFFLKCLDDAGSDMPLILRRFAIDQGRLSEALLDSLEDFKAGNASRPVFSPLLIELFEAAWLIASLELCETRIRSAAVLLAFLAKPAFFGSGRWMDMVREISRDALKAELGNLLKGSTEGAAPAPGSGAKDGAPAGAEDFLAKYCTDFTAKAREGKIDPVFGRDAEIRQIVDILARRRKNNPILVGDPGVGKTAVMEGLALRVVEGDVPESLTGVTLLGLEMGALEAGAGMKGEFERRLQGLLNAVKASERPIILFIDEAHTLIGAGGATGGSDAANLLKPALARGEIKTCAATTWSEYKKYFEKDAALARRFQLVRLEEPSVQTAALILRGLRDSYEKCHKVVIRDDAMEAAAVFSDRYISGRFLPDKAIDLLDTSCARVKVNLTAKPAVLEDKERSIQALEREKRALDRDLANGVAVDKERQEMIVKRIGEFTAQAEEIRQRWLKEQEAAKAVLALRAQLHDVGQDGKSQSEDLKARLADADKALAELQKDDPLIRIEVCPDLVAQVVSDWTGIPLGKVQRDEAQTIIHLEDRLKARIRGQDHALESLAHVIRAAKSGIKNPNQPMGVFLLVGPSGVGKTETGLALAELLFGGEKSVVTINMSEFQEKHTVSRLIGSPPGYVGYGEGGMLTEAVRRNPYSVVLLDEVEKAHVDVLNIFYQVFDKGMLADGEGKVINFKNTVIMLTSNLGTDVIQEMAPGEERPPSEAVMAAVRPILSQHFKPALLARMTVIPYYSLPPSAMRLIVELKLGKLRQTLMDNNRMAMTWADAVSDQITARCTEVETGARNIEYILNGNVLPQMSQMILSHMSEGGMPAKVHLDVAGDGGFSMVFGA